MFRIGFGNDIHRLENGESLILGGLEVPSEKRAVGHSDADALLHAVTDAILGALALGDIGSHFSDSDEQWKGASSELFLEEAVCLMKEKNYEVGNLDSVIMLESPKLRPHIDNMRAKLAAILDVELSSISIKAKTNERLDAVGNGDAIKVEAVILLMKSEPT